MMNRVVLVGRLTRDPELRYTPNGVAVANFTVACNRPFSGQDGNREADFINCVVWRRPAENLANYMKKGSLIGVDGRIQTRSYDNQEGRRVFVTEVVADNIQFLESRGSSQDRGSAGFQTNQNQPPQDYNNDRRNDDDIFEKNGEPIDLSDDDLPF
ncbi:single-stranded DNA-binding protein [Gracilibacillus dipsosauri]|uniref:single-stranded DNA-binding protein n=1 Tax=Gracilibacillus dipsosauri TaxID=178340 RepID=UPI002409A701